MIKALRRAGDRRRQLGGHHAWRFEPYGGSEVIALDCETTHLDPRRAELVALAAVKVRDGRVLTSESLDLRLQRPESLSGDSIRIHGLRGVDLWGGEALGDALDRLLDFIGNRPLVGWCIDYDMAVINRHLRPRTGFDLPNRTLDVCRLYARERRRVQPDIEPDMRFEAMSEALGVPVMGRHTALGDAVTTALMYLRLCHRRALSA
ncbi:3'-5' exonuclease [Chromohalobacter sarecensis]|uniref:3'-5' exonuclease n=1 Tax=Chromohalobacter sarecensis TaxID=245294 RepID=A0ABV9D0L6_9GAMM|nr:3'-5' exonuclease [Chromohalobacter sarecensis]MCK0713725.1 3'-5' exonuclease [Chromohalobacter sarecensis]